MRSLQARQKTVKSFSSANDMDRGSVPDQLTGLSQAEKMLIAKGCPVMRVYRVERGQRGYGGHVVNLAQNIGNFACSMWSAIVATRICAESADCLGSATVVGTERYSVLQVYVLLS